MKAATNELPERWRISLAQYSLHRLIGGGGAFPLRMARRINFALKERPSDILEPTLDPINFPAFARERFDIDAVEYVSGFYTGRATDKTYLNDLKQRADDAGVDGVLMMVDGEGALGAASDTERTSAIEKHKKWLDAAARLGCGVVRVFAHTDDTLSRDEQRDVSVDGIGRLAEYAKSTGIELAIENKVGPSCDASWLVSVVEAIGDSSVGTLPDFGNFNISPTEQYDVVKGVTELMPYAKGVSVKTFEFDNSGNETTLPFTAVMEQVFASGYSGYLGLEFEGTSMTEVDGVRATKRLVNRLIDAFDATEVDTAEDSDRKTKA
ncbi:MAG: sugar phosphate isomerase/epimerase family protein [Pseudomonadota bacterium]